MSTYNSLIDTHPNESISQSKQSFNFIRLILILCVISTIAILFVAFFRTGKDSSGPHHEKPEEEVYKHVVKYHTPVLDQQQRGTCWDFATLSLVEAAYMKQGYENGWLKENEYVQFSTQAYGVSMIDLALEHPEFFPDTKTASYHASDGYVYWLYLFQDYLKNAIVPWDVPGCEYQTTEDEDADGNPIETKDSTDYLCDYLHKDTDKNIEKNPIRLKNVDMETFIDFRDVKEYMKKSSLPAGFSVMLTSRTFYLPCDNDFFSGVTGCAEGNYVTCPTHLGYSTEKCATIVAPMVDDGVFTVDDPETPRGGHAMSVVGFTDTHMVDLGASFGITEGGFIIKNSWSSETGHSVYHYTDEWSSRTERHICPFPTEPKHWVPCEHDTDQWKLQDTTILSCRTTDHHYPSYLSNLSNLLDEMDCEASTRFCYESSTSIGGGLSSHKFRKWAVDEQNPLVVPDVYDEITIDYLPMNSLTHVFQLSTEQADKADVNDVYNCGYYFYPYETLRRSYSLWGEFWALGYQIEFDKCSFAANKKLKECKKYDYTYVEKSTHTMKLYSPADWVSPMPIVEDLLNNS